jgi:ketosteroid isomerase-like protein
MCERLREAQNAHDAEQMAALFAPDYRSDQPVHPGRRFVGNDQVRENWTGVFAGVPDFASTLLACSVDGDTEWAEWSWAGSYTDGTPFAMCGVTLFVIRDGLISEGRLYMQLVDSDAVIATDDIDSSVQELYRPPPS